MQVDEFTDTQRAHLGAIIIIIVQSDTVKWRGTHKHAPGRLACVASARNSGLASSSSLREASMLAVSVCPNKCTLKKK